MTWRWSFGVLSVPTCLAVVIATALIPDAKGQPAETRVPIGRVFRLPGVAPVLDLTAWTLTAVGTAWLTAKLTPKHEQLPGGSTNTNDEGGFAMTPGSPSSSVRRPTDPLGKS